MKQFLYLLLLSISTISMAQQEPPHIHYIPDPAGAEHPHSLDITKMRLEVLFDAPKGMVQGVVRHEFTTLQNNIDTIFFDGPGIEISQAFLDDKPVRYTTNKEGVVVHLDKPMSWDEKHQITFYYKAFPKRGIYFIGWNEPENKGTADITYIRKQIWTQGQGTDNRYWIPMYDHLNDKFITETKIKVPAGMKALSNGKKINQYKNTDGTETWEYAMEKPHSGYLLMLAIGNYEIKSTTTKRGTPVNFWYYPEFKETVEPTSIYTEKMIEMLEDLTGTPYPWGSYSQVMVQNFLYGAMENTSATVFGDFFTVDARGFKDRNYMGVNCHELTHQWFGDLITARGGSDHWLQESFATFYPKFFYQWLEGDDAYQWGLRNEYNSALAQSKKDNYPVRHTMAGTARHYPKGSAVLSMLHYLMGKENFERFIQYYLQQNGFKNVETADFQKAIKDKLGMNYDWFFDQWIYRGGEPHFLVKVAHNNGKSEFTIEQTHKIDGHTNYFKMPVVFALYLKSGEIIRDTQWVKDTKTQTIVIPNGGKEVAFALFDEQDRVMKSIQFEKTKESYFAQAEKAKYMIDRYDAVVGLRSVPVKEKLSFLQTRFQLEKYHAIRAEIAAQLANEPKLSKWYMQVVNDKKAEVKLSFIKADTLIEQHLMIFEMLMKDSSYQVAEQAFRKVMSNDQVSMKNKNTYFTWLQSIAGQNNNIRMAWLESALQLSYGDKDKCMEQLTQYCSGKYEFRTRVAAANVLSKLNLCTQEIGYNLIEAALSNNSRLAEPCLQVLRKLYKTHKASIEEARKTMGSKLNDADKERLNNIVLD